MTGTSNGDPVARTRFGSALTDPEQAVAPIQRLADQLEGLSPPEYRVTDGVRMGAVIAADALLGSIPEASLGRMTNVAPHIVESYTRVMLRLRGVPKTDLARVPEIRYGGWDEIDLDVRLDVGRYTQWATTHLDASLVLDALRAAANDLVPARGETRLDQLHAGLSWTYEKYRDEFAAPLGVFWDFQKRDATAFGTWRAPWRAR